MSDADLDGYEAEYLDDVPGENLVQAANNGEQVNRKHHHHHGKDDDGTQENRQPAGAASQPIKIRVGR